QLDRVPADLRLRLQHDQRPGRAPRRDEAARAEDLRDRVRALRDGLRGGADRGALRDPARRLPRPAPPAPVAMRGPGGGEAAPGRGAARPRGGRGTPPGRVAAWALLFLGGVLMVTPFVYMVATSLKRNAEVYELSLLPRTPTLDNYRRLLGASGFPRWFLNSCVIATLTTASVAFFDSLSGYTLAKFRFRGRGVVFVAILSTLMIPTEMLVLPWYLMSKN